jgi:hypothetical protein
MPDIDFQNPGSFHDEGIKGSVLSNVLSLSNKQ